MKLRTFLIIIVPLVVVAVVGAFYGMVSLGRVAMQPSAEAVEEATHPPTPRPIPVQMTSAAAPARPWDAVVLGYQGQDIGSDQRKDVSKGRSYKVNVYQDAGHDTANRAQVDIDRDDKWDEKWTFPDDGVTRQVAPKDDEDYTESWTWTGREWLAAKEQP